MPIMKNLIEKLSVNPVAKGANPATMTPMGHGIETGVFSYWKLVKHKTGCLMMLVFLLMAGCNEIFDIF